MSFELIFELVATIIQRRKELGERERDRQSCTERDNRTETVLHIARYLVALVQYYS